MHHTDDDDLIRETERANTKVHAAIAHTRLQTTVHTANIPIIQQRNAAEMED